MNAKSILAGGISRHGRSCSCRFCEPELVRWVRAFFGVEISNPIRGAA